MDLGTNLAQSKHAAIVNALDGDVQRLQKEAWILAYAVLEARRRLPTTWNELADELLS